MKERIAAAPSTARLLVTSMLPFVVPILATFALVLLVGERWPRQIAPGSGLKLAGLGVAAGSALVSWWYAVRQVEDRRIRRFAAILCGVTGLMGWPVWSVGVLPSLNGSVLAEPVAVRMQLERTDTTPKSRSRDVYHWAWLKAEGDSAPIRSGRYFVSEADFRRLSEAPKANVDVTVARGLLGAQVVIGLE